MSSILKALRKLEEEKARRHQGSPDIARDILTGNFQRRKASTWALPCGLFLLVTALGLLGYLFAEGDGRGVSPRADAAGVVRPATVGKEDLPTRTPVAAEINQDHPFLPTAAAGRPASVVPSEPVRLSAVTMNAPPETPAPPADPVPPSPEPAVAKAVKLPTRSAAPSSTEAVASPPAVSRAAFQLSGVAFQEEPDARMAIVNDLPVMTGTIIDGARVEEILRDRVRLSYRGQRFEVRLEGGPTE